jgi:hypothetical protein
MWREQRPECFRTWPTPTTNDVLDTQLAGLLTGQTTPEGMLKALDDSWGT